MKRATVEGTVIVRQESRGSMSWDIAAASELVNSAIGQATLGIRQEVLPGPEGLIPLRITVTVETKEGIHENPDR